VIDDVGIHMCVCNDDVHNNSVWTFGTFIGRQVDNDPSMFAIYNI
jgi:hypothetical protein